FCHLSLLSLVSLVPHLSHLSLLSLDTCVSLVSLVSLVPHLPHLPHLSLDSSCVSLVSTCPPQSAGHGHLRVLSDADAVRLRHLICHRPPSHLVSALACVHAPATRCPQTLPLVQDKPYEYVTVDSPHLASVSEDGRAFAEHVDPEEGTTNVVTFRNMRKDARLVVPCRGEQTGINYAHLAAFVRTAPRIQVIKFFGAVGVGLEEEVDSRVDESPVWLSTSGLGVYWCERA
ncbi:unnamed protein product, partial [Laminaria digitata]